MARAAAASARSMSAAPTSRCVTARTVPGATGPIDHALGFERRAERGRVGDAEHDDVRLDRRRVERDPVDRGQPFGEPARVGVVVGQPLDVVVERVQAGRGDHARLAHRAAPHLLVAPRLGDQLRRAGQHGADRRAEALGQVDPGGVEAVGVRARLHAARDDGVHQPRAVQVRPQAVLGRDVEDREDLRRRPDQAAAHVHRLLDGDEPRPRGVAVARRALRQDGAQRVRAEDPGAPGVGRQHGHHRAADRGRAAALEAQRVGELAEVQLVAAGADVQAHPDRVAHRAARQEDRGLLAEQRGHALLEREHRRVLAALLVAHLRGGHRGAHRLGRAGLGVGVEIDHSYPRSDGHDLRGTPHQARRAAQEAARRPWRLPVPRRQGQGHLRRQGQVASRKRVAEPLLQSGDRAAPTRWSTRSTPSSSCWCPARPRRCWPSRTSSSSTGRASTSACATTSPIRSSRSRWTRSSRASTSRASATAARASTSARTRAPSACAARSTCSARCSCSAPARASSRGGARARRAWTTTSSAAGRPASATCRRRSTWRRSTASSRSSAAATARSSATSSSA